MTTESDRTYSTSTSNSYLLSVYLGCRNRLCYRVRVLGQRNVGSKRVSTATHENETKVAKRDERMEPEGQSGEPICEQLARRAKLQKRPLPASPEFSSGQRSRQGDERAEPPITELPPLPQFIATPRAQLTSDEKGTQPKKGTQRARPHPNYVPHASPVEKYTSPPKGDASTAAPTAAASALRGSGQ